jgi:hypothetical protein
MSVDLAGFTGDLSKQLMVVFSFTLPTAHGIGSVHP